MKKAKTNWVLQCSNGKQLWVYIIKFLGHVTEDYFISVVQKAKADNFESLNNVAFCKANKIMCCERFQVDTHEEIKGD